MTIKKRKTSDNPYMKYSGMAMQLFFLILIAVWVGKKLDAYFLLEKPLITALLAVLALLAFLVKVYKDLT